MILLAAFTMAGHFTITGAVTMAAGGHATAASDGDATLASDGDATLAADGDAVAADGDVVAADGDAVAADGDAAAADGDAADADGDAADADQPAALSVPPLDHVTYPDDRPDWVEAEDDLEAVTHRLMVRTPPCESREECEDRLARELVLKLQVYPSLLLDDPAAAFLFPVDDKAITERVIARRYDGELRQGELPAFESVLELRIDAELQHQLRHRYRNRELRDRYGALAVLGVGGWVVMAGLAGMTAMWGRRRGAARRA